MKVVIGAGQTKYDSWLSTQEDELNLLSLESWIKLSKPESMNALLAEHVWEHLTYEEGVTACEAWLSVSKTWWVHSLCSYYAAFYFYDIKFLSKHNDKNLISFPTDDKNFVTYTLMISSAAVKLKRCPKPADLKAG